MTTERDTSIESTMKDIDKRFGRGTIMRLGDRDTYLVPRRPYRRGRWHWTLHLE